MSTDSRVDPDEVRHVAQLARIHLDDDDLEAFTAQFAEILEHFETLDDVPEVDSEPELVNVLRSDEVQDSLSQTAALQNAPETEDGFFKGPRVG